jgi:hypothetical protein
MNDTEDLLILTLNQLNCLPSNESQKIQTISQIKNEDFAEIIVKVINKIIQIKNLEIDFPESASKEMNKKYVEAQKIVEFIKNLGLRGDLGINQILFPSQRDMQNLLEFTLEIITQNDTGADDFTQVNEQNLVKKKIGKILNNWKNENFIIPELNENIYNENDFYLNEYYLKIEKSKMKELNNYKKKFNENVSKNFKENSKNTTKNIENSDNIFFIQEEDNEILKFTTGEQKHNYLIEKLKLKNSIKSSNEKEQNFINIFSKRNKAIDFLFNNYKENNFINNVNIIKNKNKIFYGGDFSNFITNLNKQSTLISNENNNNNNINNENEEESKTNVFKNKLETIISNFEEEKRIKNEEINELNNKLLSINNQIEKYKQNHIEHNEQKTNLLNELEQLSNNNQILLKEIEDQMKAYEQMKKFQSKEMVENDVINEVENLEKKYQNMVNNWNDYSNQAKSRIQELKTAINTKKKEYTYKSDQINVLKKEIEEISSKIQMKQELAQFLSEEYQKIPLNINRNSFINRIAELTNNINKERQNISQYLKDLNEADMKINKYNETIKRVDNELEDIIFQDAKNNRKLNDVYAAFIKLRDGYSNLQKNIIDNFNKKSKLRELESQVYDYKIKLKSYDMNQLQEQINFLKNVNKQ